MLFILVLVTFIVSCAAAPNCDLNGLLPCLQPTIAFAFSPEGQQFQTLKEGGELTEPQLQSICRLGQSTASCVSGYIDRCVSHDIPDIHTFIQGTVKLLEVCGTPDLWSKTKVLITCNKKVNATSPVIAQCHEDLKNSAQSLKGSTDLQQIMQKWQTGLVLRDMCCSIRQYRRCTERTVVERCGSQAAAINADMYTAINDAYKCSDKFAQCAN